MALKKDLNYYITRLDYVKFLWIHVVTWVICLLFSILVFPIYLQGAPFASFIYTKYFIPQKNIVNPKSIIAKDYEIGETKRIDLINGQRILYVTVNNKANPNVGFFPWVYTYQVLSDDGEVLVQKMRNTEFLLPEEQTYIIVYTDNPKATKLRIQPSETSVLVPHNPNSPNFLQQPKITQKQATITENTDKESYKLLFLFKNEDQLEVVRFDFVYILRDRQGQIIGLSNSLLTGFWAGTEREIEVLKQPKPNYKLDNLPTLETIVRINYLDQKIVILR